MLVVKKIDRLFGASGKKKKIDCLVRVVKKEEDRLFGASGNQDRLFGTSGNQHREIAWCER